MAHAFALLGTNVVLIESSSRVLPQEAPDASAVVARALTRAGVTILTGSAVERVTRDEHRLQISVGDRTFATAATLIAAGRAPSVSALNLTAAGVGANERGVVVDDCLRTSNRRIFAAGDVCSPHRYTHAADAMARLVVQNALFPGRARASALLIPRCTYTMPEVAHVGADAGAAGMQAVTIPLDALDRAVIDAETEGFVRIVHKRGRIYGATIVAPHAGDLAGHVVSLIRFGGTLGEVSGSIFAYPTLSDALRKAGDAYRRESLTPGVRRLLARYFAFRRR
jgi:pyruvate/2-oxoglutarate dehydrogenase complex dihydrolipoamide dehydrogenase (E3) component